MPNTRDGFDEASLRRRAKGETLAAHQRLEAQLGLLDPGLDVNRYRRVLRGQRRGSVAERDRRNSCGLDGLPRMAASIAKIISAANAPFDAFAQSAAIN